MGIIYTEETPLVEKDQTSSIIYDTENYDLTTGELIEPEVNIPSPDIPVTPPIAQPRITSTADREMSGIKSFVVKNFQELLGFPAGLIDKYLLGDIREAGKEGGFEEGAMDLAKDTLEGNFFDDSLMKRILTVGQAKGIIPKRYDVPELRRYLSPHLYEDTYIYKYVQDPNNPENEPIPRYVGEGEYVGGGGSTKGLLFGAPVIAAQRYYGKKGAKDKAFVVDSKGNIQEIRKGQLKSATRGEKAREMFTGYFSDNMTKATLYEMGLAALMGESGQYFREKAYQEAVDLGKSQEEADNAALVGELKGTFGIVGFQLAFNTLKSYAGPKFTSVLGKLPGVQLSKKVVDRTKPFIKRTVDVVKGKETYKSAFKEPTVDDIIRAAEEGDAQAIEHVKKVGAQLEKLFEEMDGVNNLLIDSTSTLAGTTSARKSLQALTEAGADVRFTLLEQVGPQLDPTIKELVRTLYGSTEAGVEQLNKRIMQNLISTRLLLQNNVGSSLAPNYTNILDMSNQTYRAAFTSLDGDTKSIVQATNKMFGDVTPATQADIYKSGNQIQQTLIEQKDRWKESMKSMSKYLGINDDDTVVDAIKFNDAILDLKNTLFAGADPEKGFKAVRLPASIEKLLNTKPTDLKKGFTFQEWKAAREALNDDFGKALKFGTSNVKDLSIAIETMDDLGRQFGAINKNFRDWANMYESGLNFYQGSLYKFSQKSKGYIEEGGVDIPLYVNPPEKVADAFITDVQSAKQFMSVPSLAENVSLHTAIQSRFFDKMRAAVVDSDGMFNPEKYEIFIRKNDEIINTFPFLKRVVTDLDTSASNIARRNAELANRRDIVNENEMLGLLSKLQKTNDPYEFVRNIYNKSDDQIRRLKADLLEEAANTGGDVVGIEKAFNRAVVSNLLESVDDGTGVFNKLLVQGPSSLNDADFGILMKGFKDYLNKSANFTKLDALLGREHVDNLFVLSDTIERLTQVGMQPQKLLPVDALTKFTDQLGLTPAMISTRFLAVAEQRLGIKQAGAYIVGRAVSAHNGRQILNLWTKALDDPQLAEYLVRSQFTKKSSVNTSDIAKIFNNKPFKQADSYLFSNGFYFGEDPPIEQLDDTEQPEGFAEGGEIVDPIKPVEKEPLDFSMAYNPELLMVPIASPQQPQQGGGQPAPTGQGGQPMDFGQLFPQDAIGGAIAQRAQPPMPQPPMPQQFQEGGEVKPYTEVTDEAGITTVSFPDVSDMPPAFGHDEEVARLMSMGLNLDQAIALAKMPRKFMSAFAPRLPRTPRAQEKGLASILGKSSG